MWLRQIAQKNKKILRYVQKKVCAVTKSRKNAFDKKKLTVALDFPRTHGLKATSGAQKKIDKGILDL